MASAMVWVRSFFVIWGAIMVYAIAAFAVAGAIASRFPRLREASRWLYWNAALVFTAFVLSAMIYSLRF